jgi:hypothetical protein
MMVMAMLFRELEIGMGLEKIDLPDEAAVSEDIEDAVYRHLVDSLTFETTHDALYVKRSIGLL